MATLNNNNTINKNKKRNLDKHLCGPQLQLDQLDGPPQKKAILYLDEPQQINTDSQLDELARPSKINSHLQKNLKKNFFDCLDDTLKNTLEDVLENNVDDHLERNLDGPPQEKPLKQCCLCSKICKSSHGLTQHEYKMHPDDFKKNWTAQQKWNQRAYFLSLKNVEVSQENDNEYFHGQENNEEEQLQVKPQFPQVQFILLFSILFS